MLSNKDDTLFINSYIRYSGHYFFFALAIALFSTLMAPSYSQPLSNGIELYENTNSQITPTLTRSSAFSNNNEWYVFINEQTGELQSASISTGNVNTLFDASMVHSTFTDDSLTLKISNDSKWVVFAASPNSTTPFENLELYAAPVDGSSASRRLTFIGLTNNSVSDFEIGPDSRSVVFLANHDTTHQSELYSVQLNAPHAVVRLNQDLIANGNVGSACGYSSKFKISSDGSTVIYQANAAVIDEFNLYSVPIDRNTEPKKLNLPIEIGTDSLVNCSTDEGTTRPSEGILQYDFMANQALIAYQIQPKGQHYRQAIYSVPIDGGVSKLIYQTAPPLITNHMSFLTSTNTDYIVVRTSEVETPFISNDFGDKLISVTANGAIERTLFSGDENNGFTARPIGVTDNELLIFSTFRATTTGNEERIKASSLSENGELELIKTSSIHSARLSADGLGVFFLSDAFTKPNNFALYKVSPSGGPLVFVGGPLISDGEIRNYQLSENGEHIAYLADRQTNNTFELFSTPSHKTGTNKVNQQLSTDEDVRDYLISNNGKHIAYQNLRQRSNGRVDLTTYLQAIQNPSNEALCFPVKLKNSSVSVICL